MEERMNKKKLILMVFAALIIGFGFFDKPAFAGVIAESRFNTMDEGGMGCVQYLTNGVTISSSQTDTPDQSNELQFYYPKGLQGNGSSGGKCWFVTTAKTEFYIEYYIKLSSNWEWHPVIQKLVYIYTPSHNTHITTYAMNGYPGAHLIGVLTNTRNLYANDPNFYFKPGRWYKIDQYYKMNDRDVGNGIIKMWVDDVLLVDVSDVVILTSSMPAEDTGLSDFDVSPVWGGIADVNKSHDDYLWFDHFTISTDSINGNLPQFIQNGPTPNSPYNLMIK
jgi:hypothetical protein